MSRTAPKMVVTLSGNTQISTAQYKFGSSSIHLDGTGDYITVTDNGNFDFGTNDFTIEWWQRLDALDRFAIDFRGGASASNKILLYSYQYDGSADDLYLYTTANRISATNSGLTANQWQHIALVRSSGTTKLYIDGTQQGSSYTDNNNYNHNEMRIWHNSIGAENYTPAGYIDEYRVSNSARYTSNFSVPTARFEDDANTVFHLQGDGANQSTDIQDTSPPYFEAGYFEQGYFEGSLSAAQTHDVSATLSCSFTISTEQVSNYFVPGYFQDGYFEGSITLAQTQAQTHEGAATLSASFTQSTAGTKILTGAATLSASFTQTTDIEKILLLNEGLEASFSVSSQGARTRTTAITMTSSFGVSEAQPTRIKQMSATIGSALSATMTVSALKNHTAVLSSAVSFTATAVKNASNTTALANIISLSLQGDRTRTIASTLTSSFSHTTQANKTTDTSISQSAQSTQTTSGDRIRFGASTQSGTFTLSCSTGLTFNVGFTTSSIGGSTGLDAVVSQSTTISRTAGASATLAGAFSPSITTDVLIQNSATLSVESTVFVSKRVGRQILENWQEYYLDQNNSNALVTGDISEVAFATDTKSGRGETYSLEIENKFPYTIGQTSPPATRAVGRSGLISEQIKRLQFSDNDVYVSFWCKPEGTQPTVNGGNVIFGLTDSNNAIATHFDDVSGNPSTYLGIGTYGGTWKAKIHKGPGSGASKYVTLSGGNVSTTSWQRVQFWTDYANSTVYFRVGNTLASGSGVISTTNNARWTLFNCLTATTNKKQIYFDNLMIRYGDLSVPSNSTGYPESFQGVVNGVSQFRETPDSTTVANLRFENNLDNDLAETLDGEATLASTASIQTSLTYANATGSATMSATASLSCLAETFLSASSTQNAQATISVTSLRIKPLISALTSTTTISATPSITRTVSSTQSSVASLSCAISLTKQGAADFDAINTQLTAASKIGDFLMAFDIRFTKSITAQKTTDITTTLGTSFTQTANVIKNIDEIVNLSSAFTQSTQGDRIRFGVSTQSVTASLTCSAVETDDFTADFTVTASLSCEIGPLRSTGAELSSTLTSDITAVKTTDVSGTFTTAFTQTTDGQAGLFSDAELDSAFSLSLTPSVTRTFEVDFDAINTQVTVAARTAAFFINHDVIASMTTVNSRQRNTSASLGSVASISTTVLRIKQLSANITATASIEAKGVTQAESESAMSSDFSQTTTPVKTVSAQANLQSDNAFALTALVARGGDIDLISTTSVQASADRRRNTSATKTVVVSISTNAGKQVDGAASISTTVTMSTDFIVIHTTDTVYVIPAETREFSIKTETRDITIDAEDREHKVLRLI